MYIVFEGIDGSGKTTLANFLREYLKSKGFNTKIKNEPKDRKFIEEAFKKVNDIKDPILRDVALSLAFAYDRAFSDEEDYDFLIGDRSFISSMAYQSIDLPIEWIFEINKFFKMPNLVIYLDVDPKVALKRIEERGKKRSYYEKLKFLEIIKENYKEVLDFLEKKNFSIIRLDANKPLEEVKKELILKISKFI